MKTFIDGILPPNTIKPCFEIADGYVWYVGYEGRLKLAGITLGQATVVGL